MASLKEQRATALKSARALAEYVKSEGRDFTEAEQAKVNTLMEQAAELKGRIDAAKPADELMARIEGLGGKSGEPFDPEAARNAKSAITEAIATKSPRQVRIGRKALEAASVGRPPEGNQAFGAPVGSAAVSLRELFTVQTVETPTVRYYTVGQLTGGPAITAEGALKPLIEGEVTAHDAAMVKLAGRFVTTTEFVEDAATVAAEFMRQALFQMVRAENKLVLDTMQAASGVIAATGDAAKPLDAIATALADQESLHGVTPEVLVMNPADLAAVRIVRSTGSGEFVLNPLVSGAAAPAIFGVPVLSTPALAKGTIWAASKDAGTFYERSALTVTSMPSNDDFDHNRVTTVIEERVLPAITQPSKLTKITLS